QMRIGINTGPVVVGRIGDDLRMDYTAVGDTTNLAARMQQIARPGSVVVTEATHKAIGGYFETLDLGEREVKGHAPVRAFEVLRPRERRSRLEVAIERGLTPLVGRERELATLHDRLAGVKAGRGHGAARAPPEGLRRDPRALAPWCAAPSARARVRGPPLGGLEHRRVPRLHYGLDRERAAPAGPDLSGRVQPAVRHAELPHVPR